MTASSCDETDQPDPKVRTPKDKLEVARDKKTPPPRDVFCEAVVELLGAA